MNINLAISRSGHDKGSIYVIVKEEADAYYLADGKGKTLEKPKKKIKNIFRLSKSFRKKLQRCLPRKKIFGMKK